MIRVYAWRQADRCRLFVLGHANSGAERDIVCAGVSALTGALVFQAVQSEYCRHTRYRMAPGEIFLSCRGLGDGFETVISGLTAIARQYPAHLQIENAS
ncbi:MAG: ribosomal-processing cysteine protease Prp [Ruminococcaceae bacterium]|nr:ribosomal-processing cysteine protease Prp [Oscillospiraceae bacterium]